MGHNHFGTPNLVQTDHKPAIALVGNPNVGKSVLFGHLTGSYANVSNYPGTTVEVTRGKYKGPVGNGRERQDEADFTLIDTPGINNLIPTSEDELVTRNILLSEAPEHVVQVIDTKNLRRGLLITLQLAEMNVPFTICLNMVDEAQARGIRVDSSRLSRLLGVEVVDVIATRRKGIRELQEVITATRSPKIEITYSGPIEEAVTHIQSRLALGDVGTAISSRALALMLLGGDDSLFSYLDGRLEEQYLQDIRGIIDDTQAQFPEPLHNIITRIRLQRTESILQEVMSTESTQQENITQRLGRLAMHPLWGVPILLIVLYGMYQFVGVLGAGTFVDFLETTIFGRFISPAVTQVVHWVIPWTFFQDMLVGEYGLLTMALSYSVAIVLPIVGTFFIAFGLLEDSGYLPRLAVMVNRIFKMIGLNGKSVLPMVLGLGCDTMATLTTRILDSRKERVIVTLLLALGVPCSAQLGVILGMLGGLSLGASVVWGGIVVGVLLLVGFLSSRVVKGPGSDFVMELPPIRRPEVGNILVKTLGRMEWYLKEAVPLFFLGTFILFVFDKLHILTAIQRVASPVVSGFLGLPAKATDAFLIGFLRRDFGAAGLYDLAKQGLMNPNQVLVSLVAITLFMPCIANFLMVIKERGVKTALYMGLFILPFAVLVAGSLNWILTGLGITF